MHGKSTWKWEVLGAEDDSRGQMEVKKGNCRVGKCEGKGQCQIVTFGQETKTALGVRCKKSDDSYWMRRESGSELNAECMKFKR
jgi:hypothetical protein